MKSIKLLLSSILVCGLTGVAQAGQYAGTPNMGHLKSLANSLHGQTSSHPNYGYYCDVYSRAAIHQIQQRIRLGCTHSIPLPTPQIADRWINQPWTHKNWCLSVSSTASKREAVTREQQLSRCVASRPSNNNAAVRHRCLANDRFHKEAARGNYSFVRQCINAGVSPNTREGNNWTPLHSAARNGHLNIVRYLVGQGTSVNARDSSNRTALDQAYIGQNLGVVQYLISVGAVGRN